MLEDKVEAVRPGMSATVEIETGRANVVPRCRFKPWCAGTSNASNAPSRRRSGGAARAAKKTAQGGPGGLRSTRTTKTRTTKEKKVDGVYVLRDGRAVFVPIRTGIGDDRFMETQERRRRR